MYGRPYSTAPYFGEHHQRQRSRYRFELWRERLVISHSSKKEGAKRTYCRRRTLTAAMAGVLLPITLCLTSARTVLVVDAVRSLGGRSSVVARAAQAATSRIHSREWMQGAAVPSSSSVAPPRPHVKPSAPGSSKVRNLHLKLLGMHAMAIFSQVAGLLKYTLPVSVSTCTVTHQIMVAFGILFDASLVTFLVAKVDVANSMRTPACWETVVIRLSRAYGWIYLPLVAVFVGVTYPGDTNDEGTSCDNSFNGEDVALGRKAIDNIFGYATHNAVMMIQFVLLLVLFVRPLPMRPKHTMPDGDVYRRLIIRNLVCTVAICATYLITTVVVVAALLEQSPENSTATICVDLAILFNVFVTVSLTEIALPLGFTSCFKTCWSECNLNERISPTKGHADEAPGPTIDGGTIDAVPDQVSAQWL
ncbi:unnamed protein product [Pylaiella littoralis]